MSRKPAVDALVVNPTEQAHAKAAGLVYVCDTDKGIARCKRGRNFHYLDADGKKITDEGILARIRSLAIPPAYTKVWICTNERGHLQATGRDARARKQYRYHPKWRATRDQGKFERMLEFGKALPRLRRRLRKDLALPGLPRDKVLALVVTLLEETMIRVGNDTYAKQNKSFGLTTLRSRHMAAHRNRIEFHFRGKSGQWRDVELDDPRLVKALHRVQELPGQRLFQYVDDDGQTQPVDSGMVNDYLRDASGGEFTAKDFRTWGGTVHAVGVLSATAHPETGSDTAMKAALAGAVKEVAAVLGNTPAVCRASYIHPEVFAGWTDGELHRRVPPTGLHARRKLEEATLAFLRCRLRASSRSR